MASKYIQKFPTPDGFPEILSDLAKEVLRNQPADILEFCALYFKCLQEGTVLDYENRGQNIPCDFKTSTPKISERPQRKKPLNEDDEALHSQALEKSSKIAKKPIGPDPLLLADEKKDQELRDALEKKKAEILANELKNNTEERPDSKASERSKKSNHNVNRSGSVAQG